MARVRTTLVLFTLLIAAWLGGAAPAEARVAEGVASLTPCFAPVRPGDTPARMIAASARFICDPPQAGLGAGDFWVRLDGLPGTAGTAPLVLRSLSLWQRAATLTLFYADGQNVTRRMDDRGATRSLQLGAMFASAVPVRGVPVTAALWRIDGSTNIRGVLAAPAAITPAREGGVNLELAALYGAFGGLCVALVVFNLALWAALRHRFQLAYCGMVLALGVYACSSSGAMAWWWPELPNTMRIRVNYLALAAAGVAAVNFARHFFEPVVFAGRTGRAARAAGVLMLASAAVFAVAAPWQARALDKLYATSFLLLMLVSVAVLVRAWRVRSNYLWLFACGWAAPIVFASLRVASNFQLMPAGLLIDNSTLISMAIEALTSSVAIAYRLRLLLRERDAARAAELAAQALADGDPLTGLLNRRAFLREATARGAAGRGWQLIVADIDHFKRVNDTLGHDGGDEVLRRVAAALTRAAPADALVARIGGEEFAILATPGDAELPERVLAAVRAAAMPFDLAVTTSLGTANGRIASEADWSRLYRLADRALYAAKAAGRDRARRSEPVAVAA